ncbi:hypothetical protein GCM10027589_54910 [Actinocorallia lasiicapitis]
MTFAVSVCCSVTPPGVPGSVGSVGSVGPPAPAKVTGVKVSWERSGTPCAAIVMT